ncbi:MAG: phospholipase D family protein [Candidatus Micrarchaeota archaeon]
MQATVHWQNPDLIKIKPDEHKPLIEVVNSLFSRRPFAVEFLVGYTSLGGFRMIEDAVRAHVSGNNFFSIITGLDYGAKHEQVFRALAKFGSEFPDKVKARIFKHANNPSSTFHPKIFTFRYKAGTTVLFGSSNLTKGGLAENHEVLTELKFGLERGDMRDLKEFERMWQYYWDKSAPISTGNNSRRNDAGRQLPHHRNGGKNGGAFR